MLCMAVYSGGDSLMIFCFCYDPVFELNASNNLGDQFRSSQKQPTVFSAHASLNTIDKILARKTHPRVLAVAAAPLQMSIQLDWSCEDVSSAQPESDKRSAMCLYPYSGAQPPPALRRTAPAAIYLTLC